MIVFSFHSVDLICSMLLTVDDFKKTEILYNNSKELCKVVGFKVVSNDFEINGMNMEHEHQHVLTFLDGSTLKVTLIGDMMMVE